ncbi:MAG: aminotransferase class IV [Minisyncoccota bacterium]
MSKIYKKAYFGNKIVPIEDAHLSVASSAVLYGLSVYTVFPVVVTKKGQAVFRLKDHYDRLINSAKIIGIDTFENNYNFEKFTEAVFELIKINSIEENSFVRVTVHVDELLPGTRSRGLATTLSMFIYEANPIIPQGGAKIKTSMFRRVPDYSIPSRAKVNGAYVNSVLGKQDALDSGYDDCLFLDGQGHVCELSAANIFIVRDGVLVTPSSSSDILEGINRKTILELAKDMNISINERNIDLTEVYIADEVFACGTSSFIAYVNKVDNRIISEGKIGLITEKIKEKFNNIMNGEDVLSENYLTYIK